jgi:hypothetical protein
MERSVPAHLRKEPLPHQGLRPPGRVVDLVYLPAARPLQFRGHRLLVSHPSSDRHRPHHGGWVVQLDRHRGVVHHRHLVMQWGHRQESFDRHLHGMHIDLLRTMDLRPRMQGMPLIEGRKVARDPDEIEVECA